MAAINKSKKTIAVRLICLLGILSTTFLMTVAFPAQDTEKVSKFGEYKGYSEKIYDSSVRTLSLIHI